MTLVFLLEQANHRLRINEEAYGKINKNDLNEAFFRINDSSFCLITRRVKAVKRRTQSKRY